MEEKYGIYVIGSFDNGSEYCHLHEQTDTLEKAEAIATKLKASLQPWEFDAVGIYDNEERKWVERIEKE